MREIWFILQRNKEGCNMKRLARLLIRILVVSFIIISGNLLIKGVPLLGRPDTERIERVEIKHSGYPEDIKEFSDEKNIELATALLGYLNYSPLKGLSDDTKLIQITYIMDDGSKQEVSANNLTVWWNGQPRALKDENIFVKMCTAVFYSE